MSECRKFKEEYKSVLKDDNILCMTTNVKTRMHNLNIYCILAG